jgi:hypothetical protein
MSHVCDAVVVSFAFVFVFVDAPCDEMDDIAPVFVRQDKMRRCRNT